MHSWASHTRSAVGWFEVSPGLPSSWPPFFLRLGLCPKRSQQTANSSLLQSTPVYSLDQFALGQQDSPQDVEDTSVFPALHRAMDTDIVAKLGRQMVPLAPQ
jgi:hypothetical protein